MDDILRMQDIIDYLKVSKATINRWRNDGSFPEPIQLGANSIGWKRSTIEKWLEARYNVATS